MNGLCAKIANSYQNKPPIKAIRAVDSENIRRARKYIASGTASDNKQKTILIAGIYAPGAPKPTVFSKNKTAAVSPGISHERPP